MLSQYCILHLFWLKYSQDTCTKSWCSKVPTAFKAASLADTAGVPGEQTLAAAIILNSRELYFYLRPFIAAAQRVAPAARCTPPHFPIPFVAAFRQAGSLAPWLPGSLAPWLPNSLALCLSGSWGW